LGEEATDAQEKGFGVQEERVGEEEDPGGVTRPVCEGPERRANGSRVLPVGGIQEWPVWGW